MATKKTQSVELKYTGSLDGAKSIYLHYGVGDTWENVTETKMRKLKSCYKTEITVPTGTTLNFCFRDADGNWDNNYGYDYSYEVTAKGIIPTTDYTTVVAEIYTPKETTK